MFSKSWWQMRNSHKIAAFLGFCVLLLSVASCFDDPFEHSKCTMAADVQTPSPDGRFKAVLYEEFCKPETQKILKTQVEVVQASQSFSPVGEVIFVIDGKHTINTIWLSSTNLQIECSDVGSSPIRSQHDRWGEVNISYKLK
jgi:hypothetical protein